MDDLLATADGGPRTDASSEELTGIMTSYVSVDLIKATHAHTEPFKSVFVHIYMCVCVCAHAKITLLSNFIIIANIIKNRPCQ